MQNLDLSLTLDTRRWCHVYAVSSVSRADSLMSYCRPWWCPHRWEGQLVWYVSPSGGSSNTSSYVAIPRLTFPFWYNQGFDMLITTSLTTPSPFFPSGYVTHTVIVLSSWQRNSTQVYVWWTDSGKWLLARPLKYSHVRHLGFEHPSEQLFLSDLTT